MQDVPETESRLTDSAQGKQNIFDILMTEGFIMKSILTAVLVMTAIIAVQMGLSYAFSFHVGETFSKTAVSILYLYAVCRMFRKRKAA